MLLLMYTVKSISTLFLLTGTITWLEFYQEKLLASGSDDGTVCVWRCSNWECTHVLTGHKYAYCPNNCSLYVQFTCMVLYC